MKHLHACSATLGHGAVPHSATLRSSGGGQQQRPRSGGCRGEGFGGRGGVASKRSTAAMEAAAASDGPGRKGEQEVARRLEASLASKLAGLASCGAGPRHLCLHPSGRLAFVVLE